MKDNYLNEELYCASKIYNRDSIIGSILACLRGLSPKYSKFAGKLENSEIIKHGER
ncbi:MAG: hypothetical protein IJL87_03420 [Clostridia bacterium]|nr:hypothetical protein [Clostridia bacterium]